MKTIGIIGAGQLGMMIAEEAKVLGAYVIAYDPSSSSPAFKIVDEYIVAPFDDMNSLELLCQRCDVVTYEFENIPAQVLMPLCEKYNIKQGYSQLLDSQDRLREKSQAKAHGLQTPAFIAVSTDDSLLDAVKEIGMPCVLKSRTLGYDGHGQCVIRSQEDLEKAFGLLSVPCILEEFINFDFEISTIIVRGDDSSSIVFPMGRNVHRQGILDLSIVPAGISEELHAKIERQSKQFMEECNYHGILTIEYFVRGEEVIFNEMAPRPHNSGHYTIEGCNTSQFRELVRYLLDIPLEEPKLVAPTIMKNILGEDLGAAEHIIEEGAPEGCYVHIYGKDESKPKRKMGHITFVGMDHEGYLQEWASRFVE
ncbi:MAG: 5-(carboxyamino)imidazole ribonucleotide synthase [Rikenellaceae bacterium]